MKLLFSLLFLSLFGKEPSDFRISYRTLHYSDFRAPVPKNEPMIAGRSVCEMVLDYMEDGGSYRYHVTAYFKPDSSFIRKNEKEVLDHEQTHFQIAYIASLRCQQALAPLEGGDSTTMERADEIFRRYSEERDRLNKQFDQETNHGLNSKEEGDWEFHINQNLNKLKKALTPTNGRNR
jgi:Bacterial protein of unknown function (DUF922)